MHIFCCYPDSYTSTCLDELNDIFHPHACTHACAHTQTHTHTHIHTNRERQTKIQSTFMSANFSLKL